MYSSIPLNDVKELKNIKYTLSDLTNEYGVKIKDEESSNNGYTNDKNNDLKGEMDNAKNIAKMSMHLYEKIRNLSNDGKLYIEDMYYSLKDSTKDEILTSRNIFEKVNPTSDSVPIKETDGNKNTVIAKTAYNNFFSANLVELKFKILGDPYWLGLCSDKCLNSKKLNDIGNMQRFIFKLNTSIEQKQDGTFDLEGVVDFTNVFQVLESTHLFSGGKFTQEIRAVIEPALIHIGRLNI